MYNLYQIYQTIIPYIAGCIAPSITSWIIHFAIHVYRPESNMLKMFSGSFQNFHLLRSSVFPLCLNYAPRLAAFLKIILEHF